MSSRPDSCTLIMLIVDSLDEDEGDDERSSIVLSSPLLSSADRLILGLFLRARSIANCLAGLPVNLWEVFECLARQWLPLNSGWHHRRCVASQLGTKLHLIPARPPARQLGNSAGISSLSLRKSVTQTKARTLKTKADL